MKTEVKSTGRNSYIEFLRFVASLIIALFHADYLGRGWIVTEFFFMLSGYFAFRAVMQSKIGDNPNEPMGYMWKTIKKIFPYAVISMLLMFFVRVYKWNLSAKDSLFYFLNFLENATLLNGTGMIPPNYRINEDIIVGEMFLGPIWYICALVVALPVMIYLVRRYYGKLGLWMVTVLPLLIDGYIVMKDGTIQGWHMNLLGFITLDFRALAGLLLGGAVYWLSSVIKEKDVNGFGKSILFLVEILLMLSIFFFAYEKRTEYTLLPILAFVLSLAITFSGQTLTSYVHVKALNFLGKLSMPIFCSHCIIIELLGCDNWIVYLAEVIVLGLLLHLFITFFGIIIKKCAKENISYEN